MSAAKRTRSQLGMTLVEVMIVLTIVAGVMVAVGFSAFSAMEKAKIKETQIRLSKTADQIESYYAYRSPNSLPNTLDELLSPPEGESPYLRDEDIFDGWGNEMAYHRTGKNSYELRSPGPDGSDNTEDDIVRRVN